MKIKHDVGLMAHFLNERPNQKREIPSYHFKIEEFKELLVYVNGMIKEIKSQHEGLTVLNENLSIKSLKNERAPQFKSLL